MVKGQDVSNYRNHHEKISKNVLSTCNFDLEFMYVLSGWAELVLICVALHNFLCKRLSF
uniref:DDE Tnp4 domain-containing protein n=1 Tax=Cajanus cajan TaxID=3821 RepID=A0A151QTN2_CAJCA|nr:hypothetical protein KK1_045538 [Cajanus cajan]